MPGGANPEQRQSGHDAVIGAQLQTTMHELHRNSAIGRWQWREPAPDCGDPPDPQLSQLLKMRYLRRPQDPLRCNRSQKCGLIFVIRARGAQPSDTRAKYSPARDSRPTHQTFNLCFRVWLGIATTTGGGGWFRTPAVLIELMGALARGGTPGLGRAKRGVPGFSQRKGPGNLTSPGLPLKGAAFCQQIHGDPSTAFCAQFATHLSN